MSAPQSPDCGPAIAEDGMQKHKQAEFSLTTHIRLRLRNPYLPDHKFEVSIERKGSMAVLSLKKQLRDTYVGNPEVEDIRLIYHGRELKNQEVVQSFIKEHHTHRIIFHLAVKNAKYIRNTSLHRSVSHIEPKSVRKSPVSSSGSLTQGARRSLEVNRSIDSLAISSSSDARQHQQPQQQTSSSPFSSSSLRASRSSVSSPAMLGLHPSNHASSSPTASILTPQRSPFLTPQHSGVRYSSAHSTPVMVPASFPQSHSTHAHHDLKSSTLSSLDASMGSPATAALDSQLAELLVLRQMYYQQTGGSQHASPFLGPSTSSSSPFLPTTNPSFSSASSSPFPAQWDMGMRQRVPHTHTRAHEHPSADQVNRDIAGQPVPAVPPAEAAAAQVEAPPLAPDPGDVADAEPREPGCCSKYFRVRVMLKLVVLVVMMGYDQDPRQLTIMCGLAVLIYIWQVRIIHDIFSCCGFAFGGDANVNAQPAQQQQQQPRIVIVHEDSVIKNLERFVVGFFASLAPEWHPRDNYATMVVRPPGNDNNGPGPAPAPPQQQQQQPDQQPNNDAPVAAAAAEIEAN
jgi:hypothetical protein